MVIQFLESYKESVWGVLLLGAMGSILGTIIWYLVGYIIKRTNKYLRYRKVRSLFKNYIRSFSLGYLVGDANTSSYKQIIIVFDRLLQIVLIIFRITLTMLITLIICSIIQNYWIECICVALSASLVVYNILTLKREIRLFSACFEMVFGEETINKAQKNAFEELKKHINS